MRNAANRLAWLLLIACTTSHAQIYSCRDASGRQILSDRPMPECRNRPVLELHSNGVVKREILPPPTAEERRQQEEKAAQAQREQKAQRDALQRDQALLSRFNTENDIQLARMRELDLLHERFEAKQAVLNASGTPGKNAGKVLPGASSSHARHPTDEYSADIAAINRKYDDLIDRFRLLKGVKTDGGSSGIARTVIDGTGGAWTGGQGR